MSVCYVMAVYPRQVSAGLLSVSLGCLVKWLRVRVSRWASIYLQALHVHTFKFLGGAARRLESFLVAAAAPHQWKTASLGKCSAATVSQRESCAARWRS